MKKISFAGSVLALVFLFNLIPSAAFAQNQLPVSSEYERAEVKQILNEDLQENATQQAEIELLTGPNKGKKFTLRHEFFQIQKGQKLEPGDVIIVSSSTDEEGKQNYVFLEKYRLTGLFWSVIIFFAFALLIGRRKTLGALIGLVLTVIILIYGVIPQIAAGHNPLWITLIASLVITASLYISHGLKKRTHISVISMLLSIGIAVAAAYIFTYITFLTGAATEDVYFLQSGPLKNLDLQSLLMSGMILGALGVLDDVVTAQSAAVDELHQANPSLSRSELYRRGMSIGREHIASLINTLFLAYTGAAFVGIIILVSSNTVPLWLALNSETLIEEIIRTIVGSMALILAVPLTTFIASRSFTEK